MRNGGAKTALFAPRLVIGADEGAKTALFAPRVVVWADGGAETAIFAPRLAGPCLESMPVFAIFGNHVENPHKVFAAGQWPPVDGHWGEDWVDGGGVLWEVGECAVVVFRAVGGRVCGVLVHVYGGGAEVCGADYVDDGAQDVDLQDVQCKGLPDHCLHDYFGYHAQADSACAGLVHRVVLLRAGARTDVGGDPLHRPLVAGDSPAGHLVNNP